MKQKTNKSVFYHLMRLSVSIILVCALLMSIINVFLFDRYAKKEKALELKHVSNQVNVLTSQYTKKYSQEADFLYQLSLNQVAEYIEGTVVIVDVEGRVFAHSDTTASIPHSMDLKGYEDVMTGSSTYRVGGFNDIFGYNTFSVASPFEFDGQVSGIIFIITKNEFFSYEAARVASMTLISVAVAIVTALLISYVLSRRLIRPLKEMGIASRQIALGKYTCINTDTNINEYSELIRSFNIMSSELEKQDKAKSDFIANVSHDLRTPLTTIMGFVGGIMDGTIPAKMQNQYLGATLSEAERMRDMVNNNLDLSKYGNGNVKLNITDFDLNEIIRSIVISMEKRIREKEIKIQLKYESTENFVEADESAIYRVIQNLLDNALKFATRGTDVEITVTRRRNLVFCRIKNYGSTIGEDEKKYIWDRYYKADQSRSADLRGRGLGLYIVKSILNQHNQDITVESDGDSVTFEFSLDAKDC